jgi:hypothetical protein
MLTLSAARRTRQAGTITDRWDCTVFRRPAASNAQVNDERTGLAGVVHAALEPTHVSVWLSR